MGREKPSSQGSTPSLIGDAAAQASEETAASIDKAAALNEDPQVAEALDQAALAADVTVSRVGWIRQFLHRLNPRSR